MRNVTSCLAALLLFTMVHQRLEAQSVRSLVNGGNDLYEERKYDDAEVKYRKALEKEKGLTAGKFNLGNALYKQGKVEESLREYEDVASQQQPPGLLADAFYNYGNALMKAQKYQEAVQSYIEALKRKPDDQDAKYNLSYALEMLKQQQQQQKQDKNDKNDKEQQNKDQKDQNKQDQKKDEQKQQQQQQQQQNQQQMAQQEKRMSKQDAERILDVLKNSERDVQKKLRVRQATRAKTEKDW